MVGVWDVMSNIEVIDFVRQKIALEIPPDEVRMYIAHTLLLPLFQFTSFHRYDYNYNRRIGIDSTIELALT